MFKKILSTIGALVLSIGLAGAANIYVDGACQFSGDGTRATDDCAASAAAAGPFNDINEAVESASAADTIHIRGAHPDSDHTTRKHLPLGDFDGYYYVGQMEVDVAGTAGNPITIQGEGWTAVGTGEKPVLIGAVPTPEAGTWTQCPTNCSSPCNLGFPVSDCSTIWWMDGDGSVSDQDWGGNNTGRFVGDGCNSYGVSWAVREDGDMAYRVEVPSDLTNSHSNYISGRCSVDLWKPCEVNADCDGAQTCSGTNAEVDSYSTCQQYANCDSNNGFPDPARIFVRWGASAPDRSALECSTQRRAFDLSGSAGYITIQGLTFLNYRNAPISFAPSSDDATANIVINDNRIFFVAGHKARGADYGLNIQRGTPISITNNEIAYTGSEIHIVSLSDDTATDITFTGNYVHHLGCTSILGPQTQGTPSGIIITGTDSGSGSENGIFTGTTIDNNIFANTCSATLQTQGSSYRKHARGIALEKNANDIQISNNIFYNVGAECIAFNALACNDQKTKDNNDIDVFNNLMIGCGASGTNGSAGGDGCVRFRMNDTKSQCGNTKGEVNNLAYYNNTCISPKEHDFYFTQGGCDDPAKCSGWNVRNNIFSRNDSLGDMIYLPSGVILPTIFTNNIVWNSVGSQNLVKFGPTELNCSEIQPQLPGNTCVDPLFLDAANGDYHLSAASSAIDAGTATDMPAARTTAINNTLASVWLPDVLDDYSDGFALKGSAWDIGAAEFQLAPSGDLVSWAAITGVCAVETAAQILPGGYDCIYFPIEHCVDDAACTAPKTTCHIPPDCLPAPLEYGSKCWAGTYCTDATVCTDAGGECDHSGMTGACVWGPDPDLTYTQNPGWEVLQIRASKVGPGCGGWRYALTDLTDSACYEISMAVHRENTGADVSADDLYELQVIAEAGEICTLSAADDGDDVWKLLPTDATTGTCIVTASGTTANLDIQTVDATASGNTASALYYIDDVAIKEVTCP
jgi:hypothetical protein